MRKISILLLSFILITISIQSNSQTGGRVITSDDPNSDPNWDWTLDQVYTVYYQSSSENVRLPYYTSGGPFEDTNSNEIDFHREDGWRLIYRDFGWEQSNINPTYPFFMLYNKYTGILRFFYYIPESEPSATYSLVKLKFLDNLESGALLTFNDDYKPFKQGYDNTSQRSDTFIGRYQKDQWGYADFNLFGYDPDLDPEAALAINIYAVDESNVNLTGLGNGTLIQELEEQNPTRSFSSLINEFYGAIKQGVSFANSAGKAYEIFTKSADKANDSGGVSINGSNVGDIFINSGNGRTNAEPISIIKGVSAAAGFISKFIGGEDQPTRIQFNLDFNLELKGTITTSTPEFSSTFALPDPNRFDDGTGSYYRPLYIDESGNDIPIGIFNIEKKPTIEWYDENYIERDDNGDSDYTKLSNLYMFNDAVKYYLNSRSDLKIKSYEISIIEYNRDSTVIKSTPFLNAGLFSEAGIRMNAPTPDVHRGLAYKIEFEIAYPTILQPQTFTVLKLFPATFNYNRIIYGDGDSNEPTEDIITMDDNDITLPSNPSTNDIVISRQTIELSNYSLSASETDELIAGNSITINPTFHAPHGSSFIAKVPNPGEFEKGRVGPHGLFALSVEDLLATSTAIDNSYDIHNLMITDKKQEDLDLISFSNAYPNPFDDKVTINFNLPEDQIIEIKVTDLNGRTINNMILEGKKGVNEYIWNGQSAGNKKLKTGIYLYTINGKDISVTNRILKR